MAGAAQMTSPGYPGAMQMMPGYPGMPQGAAGGPFPPMDPTGARAAAAAAGGYPEGYDHQVCAYIGLSLLPTLSLLSGGKM